MKRLLAVLLVAIMALALCAVSASADELSADVYVTICDEGKLAVTAQKITVTDTDSDGALTINDTLYAAHEALYPGGAAEGYATENTQYGLSLTKLWGVANGMSAYVYYLNNDFSAVSNLTTQVNDGDYVAAYSFVDLETWSDKYSYFDRFTEDITAGDVTLTLKKADFDENWAPITVPIEGAMITVDGAATGIKTDENGVVTFPLSANGTHLVSAAIEGQTVVPPVYVANVSGGIYPVPPTAPQSATVPSSEKPSQPTEKTDDKKATDDSSTPDSSNTDSSGANTNAVQTGPSAYVYIVSLIAIAALAVFVSAKKRDEDQT